MNLSLSSKCHVTVFYLPPVILTSPPPIRGFLRFCLLYQRDLHLKKPTVPPRYSTPACFRTNRPSPTCSSSSRLPSYHQVSLLLPSSKYLRVLKRKLSPPAGVLALPVNGWVMRDITDKVEQLAWTWLHTYAQHECINKTFLVLLGWYN